MSGCDHRARVAECVGQKAKRRRISPTPSCSRFPSCPKPALARVPTRRRPTATRPLEPHPRQHLVDVLGVGQEEVRDGVGAGAAATRARELLALWTDQIEAQDVPPDSSVGKYAYYEARRSFVRGIHRQIKLAKTI